MANVINQNTLIPAAVVAAMIVTVAGAVFWLADVHATVNSNTKKVEKIDQIAEDVSYIKGYIDSVQTREASK